ncbi:GntR family transcriptional regulator [Streptomyces sp. NPDC015350]|uniref:GntR family transcriptional regulator n=1 Tax=Streptomyces sp. NPDC015350 TaxID=3364955 RepID=UPI0037001B59
MAALPPCAGPPPADADVLTHVRDRIAAGQYVPGTRLTLHELHDATGHPHAQLRLALEHLAGEGVVNGRGRSRWRVPGDRPVERTRHLLAELISHGAYLPGNELPPLPGLAAALLTSTAVLHEALPLLAGDGLLDLAEGPHPRPRVLQPPGTHPSQDVWPPAWAEVLRVPPGQQRTGASRGRHDLREISDRARWRWHHGVCLPAKVTSEQEVRQSTVQHRLVREACGRMDTGSRSGHVGLRAAAARVMACASLPADGLLHQRAYRITVLAAALADLADELFASRPPRPSVPYPARTAGGHRAGAA